MTVRAIVHVDMDAFYASVEVLDDASLAGRPLIVGGTGPRGVVASCSYEARAVGVRNAMPTARARRLSPNAVVLAPRFDRYRELSKRIHAIFRSYTPLVEGLALDEAYLDVTGAGRLFGAPVDIATAIRERVRNELGLSASVGVGTNKLVAKLASEAAKPKAQAGRYEPGAGVVVVEPGDEIAFLHPHPAGALPGVGPATRSRIERFGVVTVGDLARVPEATLIGALGNAAGRHLHALAWGRDESPVEPHRPTKSVSQETTYPRDIADPIVLTEHAVRLGEGVAQRLQRSHLAGRTVTLKVRFADFRTITRSRTLPEAVDTATVIGRTAADLLDQVDTGTGVRLIGVGVSNLAERTERQLSLDEAVDDGVHPADAAADAVRRRFGPEAIGLARHRDV